MSKVAANEAKYTEMCGKVGKTDEVNQETTDILA